MAILDILIPELPPLRPDAHGVLRIAGTRVPLETVITEYRNGADAEEIAFNYDVLRLADVYSVLSYCLKHPAEVDAYLAERESAAEKVRAENEHRTPTAGVRERLLARRSKTE